MKKTFILFKTTLRRSLPILIIALLGGGLFCLIYNGMASLINQDYEGIPIGFYPHEETAVTADLRAYLQGELGMELTESADTEFLNTEMVERNIAAVVEVPKGFEAALLRGEGIPLEVSFLDDYENSAFVMSYLENYTAGLTTLALGAGGSAKTLERMMGGLGEAMMPVNTRKNDGDAQVAATQQNAFRQVLGFYLMFSFMLAFGLAGQLLEDRKKGLYMRMKATRLRTAQYLIGACAPSLLYAAALIAPFFVYMALAKQAIGLYLWQAVVLCLLYSLFVVAFAVLTSMYLNTRNALSAAIIGTATITCMLGGAYFPLESSPLFLQRLARATPQFWFVDAVYTLQSNPKANWLMNAGVIVLFALLFFILAGIRFVQGGKKKRASA